MADFDLHAAARPQNVRSELDDIATRIQDEAANVKHLLAAADEPIVSLSFHDAPKAEQVEAMERLIVLTRLAKEAAIRAGQVGEKLEGLAARMTPAEAPN